MNPFFSIIIPTYNSEIDIRNSIDSILNQKFKNFEIIVVDGLSMDKTVKIVQSYNVLKKHTIRCYSEKDRGVYDAMNKGIALARGNYLYFMGSDDTFYTEDVLDKVYNYLISKNKDVVYGNISSVIYGNKYDGEFTFQKMISKNIGHQAIFFKRRVFNIVGIFDLKYKVLADWDHNIRWFFSDKISNSYLDIIIANFGRGGLSETTFDEKFELDRPKKLFKYGSSYFSKNSMIYILSIIIDNSKNNNNLKDYIYYSLIKFIKYSFDKKNQ